MFVAPDVGSEGSEGSEDLAMRYESVFVRHLVASESESCFCLFLFLYLYLSPFLLRMTMKIFSTFFHLQLNSCLKWID